VLHRQPLVIAAGAGAAAAQGGVDGVGEVRRITRTSSSGLRSRYLSRMPIFDESTSTCLPERRSTAAANAALRFWFSASFADHPGVSASAVSRMTSMNGPRCSGRSSFR
jgi:hypothetical protein